MEGHKPSAPIIRLILPIWMVIQNWYYRVLERGGSRSRINKVSAEMLAVPGEIVGGLSWGGQNGSLVHIPYLSEELLAASSPAQNIESK